MKDEERHFWLWTVTDPETGRRRVLGYRMTEDTARERYGEDARKVLGSEEVRTPAGTAGHVQRPPKPAGGA